MRIQVRGLAAGVLVTLALGLAASTATANSLRMSNRPVRVAWTELEFRDETGTSLVTCPVTLEGSFTSAEFATTFSGTLIGYVTRGLVRSEFCRGGSVSLTQETLPWHLTYDSFGGILPRITEVKILLHQVAFEIELFFLTCSYRESGVERYRGFLNTETGGGITTLTAETIAGIVKWSGGGFCPERLRFEGSGSFTVLGSTAKVTMTLI